LAVVRLARLLLKWNVDILHTHHYDGAVLGTLAAKLARVSRVVIGRHYHDELYLLASGAKLRALLAVESFCNRHAHAIVVPSVSIHKLLTDRQSVPVEKVRVVPYGFDFTAQRYAVPDDSQGRSCLKELGLDSSFVIGNFARQHPLKGQEYLIRAFSRLVKDFPNARLLMVGDGPHHRALRALAEKLALNHHLVFTGWRRDVNRLMAAVDLVVHPTLHEALPQLMVEALIHSRPLIITEVSGVTDHIEHQATGVLIPKHDETAIYRAMRWVVEHPDQARLLGQRGRAYVMDTLDIRRVIRQYESCYEAVAA
jgi:glycosyltransferase involved in cell wall biosynthesis